MIEVASYFLRMSAMGVCAQVKYANSNWKYCVSEIRRKKGATGYNNRNVVMKTKTTNVVWINQDIILLIGCLKNPEKASGSTVFLIKTANATKTTNVVRIY